MPVILSSVFFICEFIELYLIFLSGGNKISSPIILEHFVVMDDYRKIAKSDINLKKGKVVDVIEKRECGEYIHTNKKKILNKRRIFMLLTNFCSLHDDPFPQAF